MTRKSFLDQSIYVELVWNIFDNPNGLSAVRIKKLINIKDRRAIQKKLKLLVDKHFINSEGYGKGTKYRINKIGILAFFIQNHIPKRVFSSVEKKIKSFNNNQQHVILSSILNYELYHLNISGLAIDSGRCLQKHADRILRDITKRGKKCLFSKDEDFKKMLKDSQNNKAEKYITLRQIFEYTKEYLLIKGFNYLINEKVSTHAKTKTSR